MPPKRDRQGDFKGGPRGGPRQQQQPKEVVRNAYTPMFEQFRDELDRHHDRRERIVKASRDITALSKKIVRKIHADLPPDVDREVQSRLAEIARLFDSIVGDVQGMNRYRYSRQMACVEELVEALTFAYYLRNQRLMSHKEVLESVAGLCRSAAEEKKRIAEEGGDTAMTDASASASAGGDEQKIAEEPLVVDVTQDDFIGGVFDLSGEMMRFATTTAAINGELAAAAVAPSPDDVDAPRYPRTILTDMQELGTMFELLPQQHGKSYQMKLETIRQSVLKVEKLGYGLRVRGSERPKGWMPDMADDLGAGEDD
ncbi:hypothetical protein PpBr36_07577 [Pyricularia pennisetigena]|uniref:hypothetical protein n=1 Tax=Pyricularia pennisetigena TaxID=1578925 RepID=UPI001152A614|nr:hypothetical protein PpBr36_07577 [Pyricularia pennisetigena]TLS25346.1 hypothetical protein PpBr36_07577 [Pyricularia pennisetigena]